MGRKTVIRSYGGGNSSVGRASDWNASPVIDGVASYALCPEAASQAPQHFTGVCTRAHRQTDTYRHTHMHHTNWHSAHPLQPWCAIAGNQKQHISVSTHFFHSKSEGFLTRLLIRPLMMSRLCTVMVSSASMLWRWKATRGVNTSPASSLSLVIMSSRVAISALRTSVCSSAVRTLLLKWIWVWETTVIHVKYVSDSNPDRNGKSDTLNLPILRLL